MRALLLALTMCVFILPAHAQYFGGSGTAEDPYRIATAADLITLGETPDDYDKHFILTTDIDLDPNLPGGQVFAQVLIAPLGFWGRGFKGDFDGNGHRLINLTIRVGRDDGCIGLFGCVEETGAIHDLTLDGVCVEARHEVGALAYYNHGTIRKCHVTGAVRIQEVGRWVGGLVGQNEGVVEHCTVTGEVTSTSVATVTGGLVGENDGLLSHCVANVDVCPANYGEYLGGLVGVNEGEITHCFATGSITCPGDSRGFGGLVGGHRFGNIRNSHAEGDVTGGPGAMRLGGLAGSNYLGEIADSYAAGHVSGAGNSLGVGGLLGSNVGVVAHCYATGDVSSGDGGRCIAGLAGRNHGQTSDCYAMGNVQAGENSEAVGGLVGDNEEGTVITSFWDVEASGQAASAGGTGLTTAEMQTASTFLEAGWDFVDETENGPNDVWKMWDRYDYPRLACEPGPNPPLVFVDINDPGFCGRMSKYEVTNAQYCDFLNAALASGDSTVNDIDIYGSSGSNSGEDYIGERYYRCDGSGYTGYGATNGGAARIHYSEGAFTVDNRFGDHPVTYVSWYGAMAFCSYFGYYLPTEDQWQAVADYDGTYTYGCGETIDPGIANYRHSEHPDGTMPVGSFGVYGYGMSDMAGNVWEWTSSSLGSNRVFRGGSLGSVDSDCAVSIRGDGIPYANYYDIGFRVCR